MVGKDQSIMIRQLMTVDQKGQTRQNKQERTDKARQNKQDKTDKTGENRQDSAK